ncbi:MAG: tetratricopeptide repeat protein [Calditrichaeota bacterium]|nr:tetratricopeptide repeat protein [Calditrichota bacterium]
MSRNKITWEKKAKKELNNASLTLCMIVKNEEEHIARCLQSVKDAVDDIVVVDTGSTDRTVEICKSFGAKVYHHPWQDSFSKARNQALKYVKTEWALQLDADEELDPADIPLLRQALYEKQFNSICVTIFNDLPEGIISKFYYRRLYRTKMAHYEGRVHNQIVVPGAVGMRDIRIYHHGYNLPPEKMAAKYERTEKLLLGQIEEEPANIFYRFNLVRVYRNKQEYDRAISEGLTALQMPNVRSRIGYYLMIVNDVCHSMLLAQRAHKVFPLCSEALKVDPLNMDLLFAMAGAYVSIGAYKNAILYYQKWLKAKQKTDGKPIDLAMSVDTYSLDAVVLENIGKCYKYIGQYDPAIENLEKAIAANPGRLSPYKALALCYIEQHDLAKATHVLERSVSKNIADSFVFYKLGVLLRELGHFDQAQKYMQRSLQLDEDAPDVWNANGQLLLVRGKTVEALQNFNRCLQINPNHLGAKLNRSHALLLLQKNQEAQKELIAILSSEPQDYGIFSEAGELCCTHHLFVPAISFYEKYLQQKPNDVKALHNLASCYAQTGNFDSARIGYSAVLNINPSYQPTVQSLEYLQKISALVE